MLDVEKVREFYFNPPPDGESRFPSAEECYARYERSRVENCLYLGRDPELEGLGEHGSLIGGEGKPPTVLYDDPLRVVALPLPPLAWLDYAAAREPWPPDGGVTGARGFLGFLSAKHLAGLRERPGGAETEWLFRSRSLTWRESHWLRHIFLCLHADSFRRLVLGAGLSVYEVARAAHNSGVERGELAFWFDPYAIRPEDLPKVPEEEWRKLRRAKEEAWVQSGARPPFRSG